MLLDTLEFTGQEFQPSLVCHLVNQGDCFLPLFHGRIKGAPLNPELFLQMKCRPILFLWHVDLGYPSLPAQQRKSGFPNPANSIWLR